MTDGKRSRGHAPIMSKAFVNNNDVIDLRPILQTLLARHRLLVSEVSELEHGWQIRTTDGPIVNIFITGSVQIQGRNTDLARQFVEDLESAIVDLRHSRRLAINLWLVSRD
jgi:hypothetical protein